MILTLLCWVSLIAFIGLTVKKFMEYGSLPQHGRQDLYPIPLEDEEKVKYGGSYMEEDKWYEKKRPHNLKGELIDMGMEMLFIKKLFIHQNSFWWVSYAMHLGLYAALAWSVLCLIGVPLGVGVSSGVLATVCQFLIILAGVISGVLMTVGIIGLLFKRCFVLEYKKYTTPQEYFNLVALLAVSVLGLINWLGDKSFGFGVGIARAMFTFKPLAACCDVTPQLVAFLVCLAFISFYIPLSKMSHYVGKYYTFHSVIWGNEPNLPGSKIEANIIAAANKPKDPNALKWEAPHINPAPAPEAQEQK